MTANDYHFITHWRVPGTIDEVYDVCIRGDLTEWWPAVYLDAETLEQGGEDGVGRLVSLYTKGWLPYTLRWQFRVTEADPPHRLRLEAVGDFVGRGIWTFEQTGEWVDVTYDWKIRADKPLLRLFSFAMKPIFAANHRWAMARGEESLVLELARRRAPSPEQRALVPPPPGPTPSASPALGLGAGAALAALSLVLLLKRLGSSGIVKR